MLAQAYITEWGARAPWPDPVQVEQDLILSRILVEAGNHELLKTALAFRGGTSLQKLYLPSPTRYSEDLDYVRTDDEPLLGEIFDAFRSIVIPLGLGELKRKFPSDDSDMGTIWFDGEPTEGDGRIRIKVEANVAETKPFLPHVSRGYRVESRWWQGEAEILTFELVDLLGTKLRALYQRRKGRDLFDLWFALKRLGPSEEKVAASLAHYMGDSVFSYRQLRRNLQGKVTDPVFTDDISGLLVEMPADYSAPDAAQLVLERLGIYLRNPPAKGEAVLLSE